MKILIKLLLACEPYMDLTRYNQRIFELAQKWRAGNITKIEWKELNIWYQSFEDTSLGPPTEHFVDRLELRLYEQLDKNYKPISDDGNSPPYPFKNSG